MLNLRGNCISDLSQLAELASMSSLHTLLLSGNSIEMSIGYPASVFELFPHVQRIDDWIRPTNPVPHHPPTVVAPTETRMSVINDAFDLQEHTLALNGQELAEFCTLLTDTATKDTTTQHTLLERFPYYRLLQVWRQQVIKSGIQQTMAEQRLQRCMADSKRDKQKYREHTQELEAKTLLLQDRLMAVEKRNSELEHALNEKNRVVEPLRERLDVTEKENNKLKAQLHRAEALFQQVSVVQNRVAVAQAGVLAKVSEKLAQQETRIYAATDRVAFTAEVVAQREIQMRNSEAAVQAEHRLLVWSRTQGCSNSTTTGTGSTSSADVEPLLEEHDRLSAEGEAYLQAVFLALDCDCRGAVSVLQLVTYMLDRDGNTPTEAGAQLRTVLGDTLWERMSTAVVGLDPTADLTYGELLLLLLPGGRSRAGAADGGLSCSEKTALREMKLLSDADWGVVPLNLPVCSTMLAQKTKQDVPRGSTHITSNTTAAECKRLSIERSFLMRRLQTMTRTLERRAEGIRSYFEDSIRRETLRADRARAETNELQQALTLSKAKQTELEQLLTYNRTQYEETVQELRQHVSELTEQQNINQSEAISKYKKLLEDSAIKVTTLEEQVFQAKSAGNKREIKCRALERSLNESRSAQLLLSGEVSSLRQRCETVEAELKQVKGREAELIQAQECWETEKTSLHTAMEDQSKAAVELQQRIAHTETQETERISTLEKEVELLQTLLKRFSNNSNVEQRSTATLHDIPQSNHMITEGKDSGRLPMQQPMQQPMQPPLPPHSASMFGVCSARLEGIVRQAEAQLAIK